MYNTFRTFWQVKQIISIRKLVILTRVNKQRNAIIEEVFFNSMEPFLQDIYRWRSIDKAAIASSFTTTYNYEFVRLGLTLLHE